MTSDPSQTAKQRRKAYRSYELGKLRWEVGDFRSALPKLERAADLYVELGDAGGYVKALTLCLRMYREMDEAEALGHAKQRIYEDVTRGRVGLTARTYSILALADLCRAEYASALSHLERGRALALDDGAKEDMCYLIHAAANVYWVMGRADDAARELAKLEVFFEIMRLPDLQMSALVMRSKIALGQRRFAEALEHVRAAFDLVRVKKNLYVYVNLLFVMASVHVEAGELEAARAYVYLAERMTDAETFVLLSRKLAELAARISGREQGAYDLVLNSASNFVVERRKGRIEFKNQFILLDLLKLFLKAPGEVHSKEQLVRAVWKQEYDPSVHDNKIYVTIKRLRRLIEPDFDKPKYIYRAKNGYYLNRNAKVEIQ